MKVIHPFKAKKVTFRDINLQKCKNDQNFLHLAFVFAIQMKTTFLCPQARNLAQTNGLRYILLYHDFVTDARTHARTHGRTEDKPAQRDPLHALGTHPVCGRRPPTPIMLPRMSLAV